MSQTAILQQVQFTNLLSFNWLQDKLKRNFQSIIEYLKREKNSNDLKIAKVQQGLKEIRERETKEIREGENKDMRNNQSKQELRTTQPDSNLKEEIQRLGREIQNNNRTHQQKEKELQRQIDQIQNKSNFTKIQPAKSQPAKQRQIQRRQAPKVQSSKNDQDLKRQIQKLRQDLNRVQKSTQEQICQIKKNKQEIKDNFNQHERMKKQLQESIKKQIGEIAPELSNLLERVNDMKSIDQKIEKMQSMMDQGVLNRVIAQEQKTQTLQNNQKDDVRNINVRVDQLKLFFVDQMNDMRDDRMTDKEDLSKRLRSNELLDQTQNQEIEALKKKVEMLDQMKLDLENLREQIEQLKSQVRMRPMAQNTHNSQNAPNYNLQLDMNYKDKINDKINKINSLLLTFVSKTQFAQQKQASKQRNRKLQLDQEKIVITAQKKNDQIWDYLRGLKIPQQKDYTLELEQIKQDNGIKNAITNKRIDQTNSRADNLKRDIHSLKQQLQNLKSNASSYLMPQVVREQSLTKDISSAKLKSQFNPSDLRREFDNKLHDLRKQLITALRDIERKMQNNKGMDSELLKLSDKLQELRLFLNKKADGTDTKKSFQYLDNKINTILGMLHKDDQNVEDARGAKKSWYCLSCDKLLSNYSGKMGKHIPWDGLPKKYTLTTKQDITLKKTKDDQLPNLK